MQNLKREINKNHAICHCPIANTLKLRWLLFAFFIVHFALAPQPSPADTTRPEVTAYRKPEDAVRVGPLPLKPSVGRVVRTYCYYLPPPGADRAAKEGHRPAFDRKDLVASETYTYIFEKPLLVRQTLLKQGKLYGIEKLWFDNGQIERETPYFEGQIDGTCRQWNQAGQLIAQYDIKDGTGHRQIYGADGILQLDEPLEKGILKGLRMERTPTGERSFLPYKNDFIIGQGYKFSADGVLHSLNFFADDPEAHQPNVNDADLDIRALHGPALTWNQKGARSQVTWWINNQQVTAAEYAAEYATAAKTDKSLPPYFADANQYKTLIPPAILALEQKYRTQPPVKIPLQ